MRLTPAVREVTVAALVFALSAAGVGVYLGSPAHARHDPVHALQQLDLFYLDQPAPALPELGVAPGRPAVVVFCSSCATPQVKGAQVVRSQDPVLAARYALSRGGSAGPGYALVDADGRLRYRTFDPDPAAHLQELQPLVDAL